MKDSFRKPSVIVVGASGFVGSYVSKELAVDFNVIKTSRIGRDGFVKFNSLSDSISSLIQNTVKGSPVSGIVLCNKFGPMETYFKNESFAWECEVASVIKLSEDCKILGLPIIYLSTSYVFPGLESKYDERSLTQPISLYGRLKRDAEIELQKSNPKNLILRLDKVVGTSLQNKHLFAEWYDTVTRGQPIRCIKDQKFSPTAVVDVAVAVKMALISKLEGVYHCANPEIWRRSDLARVFLECLGITAKVTEETLEQLELRELRPAYSGLKSDRLIAAIGIKFTPMRTIFLKMKKPAAATTSVASKRHLSLDE